MLPALASIPDFVWRGLPARGFGVPLLLFHWLAPEELERYLLWLKDARYRSLTGDEVAAVARGEMALPDRAVALTFDDGVYNNWSVVAPLLRRHGFHGIAFVVPRLLRSGGKRPTIDDVAGGRASLATVLDDAASGRYMTWDEAAALDAEGVVEIQSHTYDHAAVFTSDQLIDFQHPRADGTPRYPWLWSAVGAAPDEPLWGAPVYPMAPRLFARRYHDDASFRDACRRFAAIRGERGFFADVSWREELARFAALERRHFRPGNFETEGDMAAARRLCLRRAREVLREHLGHDIDHIAVPWSRAAADAPELIREAGYRSAYTHEGPSLRLRPGADPFRLPRLEGYWLESLPATQRLALTGRVACALRNRLSRAF